MPPVPSSLLRVFPWALAAAALALCLGRPALADDGDTPPPCAMPMAGALADRPGTGRNTSTGGSPCVADPGETILETGYRRQTMTNADGQVVLTSVPLTFVRVGVARHFELGIAPPVAESRSVSGNVPLDAANGQADVVFAAKYRILDRQQAQASVGVAYSPPTGTGEFTDRLPTYSASGNFALSITAQLSISTSQTFGTAIGPGDNGQLHSFFVYTPSYTLAYALDGATTVLVQAALSSRQAPTLPSGDRNFFAVQRALGDRVALDAEYEVNAKPTLGAPQHAFGVGVVWIATKGRSR
ncbi:MAG TPA: hypothetical protein VMA36_09230 [Candidatus Limnocylindria bacterium]|nr:hypothetical protein [Candidatus Limnocylindria bacterium]